MSNRLKVSSVTAEDGPQGVVPVDPGVAVVDVETGSGTNPAITLPNGELGQVIHVINNTGVTIKIWPALGAAIGSGAVNAAVSVKAQTGRHISFISYKGNKWSQSDVQWR
jgi:hypothetical protein